MRRASRSPVRASRGGVDAACEQADFVDRCVDVVFQRVERLGARRIPTLERGGRQPELQAQRYQPLLGAIV